MILLKNGKCYADKNVTLEVITPNSFSNNEELETLFYSTFQRKSKGKILAKGLANLSQKISPNQKKKFDGNFFFKL